MIDPTLYAVPFFLVTMLIESLLLARMTVGDGRQARGYEARDTAASLTMGVGNVVINLFMKGVSLASLGFFAGFAPWKLDSDSMATWAMALLVGDFCYYWFHRASHQVRFLWAAHVNHHSSRHYNLSTALRQSWTTPLTYIPFFWPMALAGFDPMLILIVQAINTLYQYWIHTEAIDRLGPLEWLLNTPSHHRVHHGTNLEYLDRNHGGMLIVWDRLFGTFEPEVAPVVYGLTKNIETFHPVEIATHEWKALARDIARADDWRAAIGYVLQPPGWSPDGSTRTADQMRAAAAA
ncbi:MAG TPA: sterol desaturase family protein [Candidatus Binatia bacterium]|nr:sterol desaturase family protein [Candidatus Binatia bacterium]